MVASRAIQGSTPALNRTIQEDQFRWNKPPGHFAGRFFVFWWGTMKCRLHKMETLNYGSGNYRHLGKFIGVGILDVFGWFCARKGNLRWSLP